MSRKLNLSKLKNKVAQLKGESSPKTQRASVFWSPQLPKGESSVTYKVFLLPFPDQEDYPFKERWFYYTLGSMKDADGNSLKDEKGRYIKAPLTLKQFGEDDPVQNMIDQLWSNEGKEEDEAKADREAAKNLFAGQTVYVPIIVEGEESLGVRLWRFSSKAVYERLCELFMKDKIGDLNDPFGDIWLTVKVEHVPKKPFPMNKKIGSIDLELLDRKPLSEDEEKIRQWMSDVPDLDENLKYQRYDYDGLKNLLRMWSDTAGGDQEEMEKDGTEAAKAAKPKKSKKAAKKVEEEGETLTKEEAIKALKDDFMSDDDDDDDDE